MKIALVIFITLALAGCALLSLHMGVIPVPWRALLTDWQAGREHYYVLMEYRLPRLRRARLLLCIDGVPTAALAAGTVCRCSPRRSGRADTGDCAQPSGITGYSRR